MIKFLVITFLVGYLIFKLTGLFFKYLTGGQSYTGKGQQSNQKYNASSQQPGDGNIRVDYVPNHEDKEKKNFKGGEYVDYEEVD